MKDLRTLCPRCRADYLQAGYRLRLIPGHCKEPCDKCERPGLTFALEDEMKTLRATSTKLQMALAQKGVYVRIDERQHYSTKYGRFLTTYILRQCGSPKQGKWKEIGKEYSMQGVVQKLAAMYRGLE